MAANNVRQLLEREDLQDRWRLALDDCARVALSESTDPSSKVGAAIAIVSDRQSPGGVLWWTPHVNQPLQPEFPLVGCTGDQRHRRVLHAEERAAMGLPQRDDLSGRYWGIVAPWSACNNCARELVKYRAQFLVRSKTVMDWYRQTQGKWAASIEEGDRYMAEFGIVVHEVETPGIRMQIHGEVVQL